MNFYKFILLAIMLVFLDEIKTESDLDLIVSKVGIDDVSPCSVGIVFFVNLNNTSENDYDVELTPDRCCLKEDVEDCDTLQIVGHCKAYIPRSTTKTLRLVAPILDPYEREGFCDIYLDSKLNKQRNKRNVVKVNFDTAIQNDNNGPINFKRCAHKDEDPLNDCKPVNCETYYNGQKTYYNKKLGRCVEVPSCISSDDIDYPEVVYNPVTNKCQKQLITQDDVDALKGFDSYKNRRTPKDVIIIREFKPNGSDIVDIDTTNSDQSSGKKFINKCKEKAHTGKKSKESCNKNNPDYVENNTGTIKVLGIIILVQSLLICFMVYCISKKCGSSPQKTVERKFFNSNNDISITTPLIATSNIDTDTAEFNCLSEISYKDQIKKCYKACQKEKLENVKMSMSDDILLKCLNRRDWKHHNNSDNFPEDLRNDCIPVNKDSENAKPYSYAVPNIIAKDSKKSIETRVAFKDETFHSDSNNKNMVVTNSKDNQDSRKSDTNYVTEPVKSHTSEKELKCHSYNCLDTNLAGLNLEGSHSNRKSGLLRSNKPKKGSFSIEKGAQAYFSNDSIEDFLSERGGICMTNENISKYTFFADSNEVKQTSSISSKTSKNFIKNVLSFLSKRSRQGPCSDPGPTKNTDLQLIHMSKATVYSSSNDSECGANLNRADSRTAF